MLHSLLPGTVKPINVANLPAGGLSSNSGESDPKSLASERGLDAVLLGLSTPSWGVSGTRTKWRRLLSSCVRAVAVAGFELICKDERLPVDLETGNRNAKHEIIDAADKCIHCKKKL